MLIKLTSSEKKRAYLLQYYFDTNPLFIILRLIGGPCIIGLGLYFLFYGNFTPILFFIICLLYGIYYICKPFVNLKLYATYFTNECFEFEMSKDYISITSEDNISEFSWKDMRKILKFKTFYIFIFQDKSRIILPSEQLDSSQIDNIEEIKKIYC